MKLQDLRPTTGASLDELAPILREGDWRSLLPSSLPDPLVVPLARDFRNVENAMWGPLALDQDPEGMAVVLCLVLHLLIDHPSNSPTPGPVTASWHELSDAIRLYQLQLEREVVTRIVGVSTNDAGEQLILDLREKVNGHSGHPRRRR